MTDIHRLQFARQYLSTREIRVPPANPDPGLTPPDSYASDLLIDPGYRVDAFCMKVRRRMLGPHQLVCLAMRPVSMSSGPDESLRTAIDNRLSNKIRSHDGTTAWFSSEVMAVSLIIPPDADWEPIAGQIRDEVSSLTGESVPAGAALFPFKHFSRKDTIYSAVYALDHACFYNTGPMIFCCAASLNILGDRRFQMDRIEDAAQAYEMGLQMDPEDVNLLNSLGVCCSISNRLDQALALFENAAAFLPHDPLTLYNAGLTCSLTDRLEQGLDYLVRACELDGSLFEIQLTTGILFARLGRYRDALDHLETASRIDPEASPPWGIMGEIHLADGRLTEAATAFNRAIQRHARDCWAMSGLARVYDIQNRNLDIALSLAEQSVDLAPRIRLFRQRLGRILLKTGNFHAAEIAFSTGAALSDAPDHPLPDGVSPQRSPDGDRSSRTATHSQRTA